MKREQIISNYIDAVERVLVNFKFNMEPSTEDISILTLKTKDFINALRELYLSEDINKKNKYKIIFDIISHANFYICKENFEENPLGNYWAVIIYNLELANKHITELHFEETNEIYSFPIEINEAIIPNQNQKNKETPKTFDELFYNPENAEPCLKILSELHPPVIDAINNYIGKAKGIFPLWVKILKNHKPNPLIKHFKDEVYKDLINQKVKGLNLSKDASEFRKTYVRIENNKIELDIKTILSQYSQSGKLGK